MNGHSVVWTIGPGVWPRPTFTCAAPVGAPCRLGCDDNCDLWIDDGICDHPKVDQGHCAALDWLNDECGTECYAGPDTEVRSGPVDVRWHVESGCYEWSYAEAAP